MPQLLSYVGLRLCLCSQHSCIHPVCFRLGKSFGSDNSVVKTFLSLVLNHVDGCATSRHEELRVWVVQDWNQDVKLRGQDRQNLSYDNDAYETGHDEFRRCYVIGGAAKQARCSGEGDAPLEARMKRLFRENKLLIITNISRSGRDED